MRATLEVMWVRVAVIFGMVKTIFKIYGYDGKYRFKTQMNPETFSKPSKSVENG